MKSSLLFLAASAALLAACSGEQHSADHARAEDPHKGHHMGPSEEAARVKKEMAQDFADRFEVEGCASSELIGTMRRTEADGAGVYIRSYQAPVECADDLEAALGSGGYTQSESGLFAGESADGTAERVRIRRAGDGSGAGIEWEVDHK